MLKLKGDTLIEVTIAVGIFSLVAVIIVSVVNSSASGAQVALETTLTREEIDAQAEALRFIQSSYISGNGGMAASNDFEHYEKLWEEIISGAITLDEEEKSILQYHPNSCAELYENDVLYNQGAFVINTKGLKNDVENVVIRPSTPGTEERHFFPASTYPRLIYDSSNPNPDLFTDEDKNDNTNKAERVEGIYVVAVKDKATTIVTQDGDYGSKSAYYDFYIRTCWYGPGADHPSTISTVICLYNPKIGTL